MSDPVELRRLRWRCRRGMRELDTLLMRYLDERYEQAGAADQAAFRALLAMPDPDILGLLTGRLAGEDPVVARVVERIIARRVP